ncbi:MAG: hypothetical protein L3J62_00265 [Gammaproteobacteria bacterium]|nr:hypothetical protein [Gammaproteobacteria bacterium]
MHCFFKERQKIALSGKLRPKANEGNQHIAKLYCVFSLALEPLAKLSVMNEWSLQLARQYGRMIRIYKALIKVDPFLPQTTAEIKNLAKGFPQHCVFDLFL